MPLREAEIGDLEESYVNRSVAAERPQRGISLLLRSSHKADETRNRLEIVLSEINHGTQ
jgi:hypothetical protein